MSSKQRWPKFNADGLYYTPAFVIPEDLAVLSLVQDRLKDEHLKKMKINSEPSTKVSFTSLVLPQPEQENSCGICKIYYKNFEEVNQK